MVTADDIRSLPRDEKLRIMELPWDGLVSSTEGIESPLWHGDVLSERRAKIERGDAKFLSGEELKTRLGR